MAAGDEEKTEQPAEMEVVKPKAEDQIPSSDKPQEAGPPAQGVKQDKGYKKPTQGADGDGAADTDLGAEGDAMEVTEPAKDPKAEEAHKAESVQKQKKIEEEEKAGTIVFKLIQNDNDRFNLEHLVNLKNIFGKQLPKMPKEYIVRLVFDRRHRSLAIFRDGQVVGGICYRPYHEQKFAEIAFCAVSSGEQVKGFGTRLMNHLKEHVKREGIYYFLTYADNFAIGYFKKQGFSRSLSLHKSVWQGMIKDYDGANLMECYIHPTINHLDIRNMVKNQKAFIYSRIRAVSKSHIVHPGLTLFKEGKKVATAMEIPGVREAGWTYALLNPQTGRDVEREKNLLQATLNNAFSQVKGHRSAWPFAEPVNTDEVTDYLDVITDPIDLSLIEKRLKDGDYYRSKEMLQSDLLRMCKNCKTYNKLNTAYYSAGNDLEQYVRGLFKRGEN